MFKKRLQIIKAVSPFKSERSLKTFFSSEFNWSCKINKMPHPRSGKPVFSCLVPLARSIPNSRARLIEKGSLNGSTLIIVYYLSRLKLTLLVVMRPLNSQFSILATRLCWWNLLLLYIFFLTFPSPIHQRRTVLSQWQVRGSQRLLLKLVSVTAAARKKV